MALSSREEKALEAIVAGIRHIAAVITAIPVENRTKALDAAERSYLQTMRDLGLEETASQTWASAAMRRLQSQLAEREDLAEQKMLKKLYSELTDQITRTPSGSRS